MGHERSQSPLARQRRQWFLFHRRRSRPGLHSWQNTTYTATVFCFDAVTGRVIWRHSYPCDAQPLSYAGGPDATPTVDGRRVFTFSKSGVLFCFDATTGKVVWSKKQELWPHREGDWRNIWRYTGSPLILGEQLFLAVGQAGLALDRENGVVTWASPAGHPGYSSPVPFHSPAGSALALFSGHKVFGVEARSDRHLCDVSWHTLWDLNVADPIIWEGRMFVSSGNGTGCVLFDIATTSPMEIWRNKHLKNTINSSVLWKGLLFEFNDAHLSCVVWDTGEEKWSTRDVRKGSLVVAEPVGEAYKPLAEVQVLGGRC